MIVVIIIQPLPATRQMIVLRSRSVPAEDLAILVIFLAGGAPGVRPTEIKFVKEEIAADSPVLIHRSAPVIVALTLVAINLDFALIILNALL